MRCSACLLLVCLSVPISAQTDSLFSASLEKMSSFLDEKNVIAEYIAIRQNSSSRDSDRYQVLKEEERFQASEDMLASCALEQLSIHLDKICPKLVYKPIIPYSISPHVVLLNEALEGEKEIRLESSYGDDQLFHPSQFDNQFWNWLRQGGRRRIIQYAPTYDMMSFLQDSRRVIYPKRGYLILSHYTPAFFRQHFRRTFNHPYYLKFGPPTFVENKVYVVIQIGQKYRRWFWHKNNRKFVDNYWSFVVEFFDGRPQRIIYNYTKGHGTSSPKTTHYQYYEIE